jgi:superoxide reductase
MQRRLFIKGLGLVGVGSALTLPQAASAGSSDPMMSPLAGSLFYTNDMPGRWAGKEGGHVPSIERNGNAIEVTTGHEMNGFEHYIIKHVILDDRLQFVREQMFDPEKDAPVSEHDISSLQRVVYAVSLCNKHDAWLNTLKL